MDKQCSKCKEIKPVKAFGLRLGKPRARCKKCRNEAQRAARGHIAKSYTKTCKNCGGKGQSPRKNKAIDFYCAPCMDKMEGFCIKCESWHPMKSMAPANNWSYCKTHYSELLAKAKTKRLTRKHFGESTVLESIDCKECGGHEFKRPNRKYNLDGLCYDCNIRYKHRLNPGTVKKCKSCGKCTGSKWKWYCSGCLKVRNKKSVTASQERIRKYILSLSDSERLDIKLSDRIGDHTKLIRIDCCQECGKGEWVRPHRTYFGPTCYECTRARMAKLYARMQELDRFKSEVPCKDCGITVHREFGNPVRMCEPCRKAAKKRQRRAARAKRSAAKRNGKADGLKVDPIAVFKRDKWRCQMCGIKTHKRNHKLDDAAELDHIVPLSKGGRHIPSNLQCLCRRCNNKKSDKLIGQPSLFSPVASG